MDYAEALAILAGHERGEDYSSATLSDAYTAKEMNEEPGYRTPQKAWAPPATDKTLGGGYLALAGPPDSETEDRRLPFKIGDGDSVLDIDPFHPEGYAVIGLLTTNLEGLKPGEADKSLSPDALRKLRDWIDGHLRAIQ